MDYLITTTKYLMSGIIKIIFPHHDASLSPKILGLIKNRGWQDGLVGA